MIGEGTSSSRIIHATAVETSARAARWSLLLLASGIIILLLMEWLLFPLTVDDAYISFRYSDNLARGHGLVWNVGEDPVEGYTNFLWVIIGAAAIRLGLDIVITAKVLGVLFSLGSVLLVYQVARWLDRSSLDTMPALLLGCSPALALWAVSGMETALFVFLLLVALYQFLREEEKTEPRMRRWYPSAVWLLLLALTRPEGIVVFGGLVVLRLILWIKQGGLEKRTVIYVAWVLLFGSLWLGYFAWRWAYFGYPFPNTAYVKAETGLMGIAGHIGVYLIPYGLRIFPFVVLGCYALGQCKQVHRTDLYLGVALTCLVLTNLVSSDWMPGHRLALPMTPLVLLLARRPLEFLLQATLRGHWLQRLAHAVVLLGFVLYVAAPLLYTANLFHRVMATQMDMSLYRWSTEMQSIVDGQYVEVGRWLADNAPPGATVVAPNVGAIGFLSDLEVIDMIGLTDEYIARHGWTVDYLLDQQPDFIVLESDTRDEFGGLYGTSGERFAATPAFVGRYELLFVLDNGRIDELALFIHHLPHATWLFAHKDLGLVARMGAAGDE